MARLNTYSIYIAFTDFKNNRQELRTDFDYFNIGKTFNNKREALKAYSKEVEQVIEVLKREHKDHKVAIIELVRKSRNDIDDDNTTCLWELLENRLYYYDDFSKKVLKK